MNMKPLNFTERLIVGGSLSPCAIALRQHKRSKVYSRLVTATVAICFAGFLAYLLTKIAGVLFS